MIAVLFGVIAAICWSLHDVVARSLANRIGPFRMALAVMLVGGLIISAPILYRASLWHADGRGIVLALLLGVAYGAGIGGLFKAFSLGPISLVAPITAAYPVLTVLWGVFMGLSPTPVQWLAVASAMAGATIVARNGPADGGLNAVPRQHVVPLLLFCLVSSVGYAAAVVLGQKAALLIGEYEATWVSRWTGALVLLPFVSGEPKPVPLQRRHWWGIATMALLDVAGMTAVNVSGFMPGAQFAGVGISAYGAVAVILAVLLLKEKAAPAQWLGIALIVGGVATIALG